MSSSKSMVPHRTVSCPCQDECPSPRGVCSGGWGHVVTGSSASASVDTGMASSASIRKSRGKLTRMVSVDLERGESLHQQQLNLQHHVQQQLELKNSQKQQLEQQSHQNHNYPSPQLQLQVSSKLETSSPHLQQPCVRSPRQSSPIPPFHFQFQNVNVTPNCEEESTQDKSQRHYHQRSSSATYHSGKSSYHHLGNHLTNNYHNHPKQNSRNKRNLSAEGWLRVQTFQQTHSASSSLGTTDKKMRLSADNARRLGPTTSQHHSRSASCLPLSRFRGFSTSREDPNHLARPQSGEFLQTHRSFDRLSLSPKKSIDKVDVSPHDAQGGVSLACSRHRTPERRCEKCQVLRSAGSSSESRGGDHSSVQSPTDPGASGPNTTASSSSAGGGGDARSRRSQFRRAISLFSLSCDKETDRYKEKSPQQKILRPPTRHVYRKGLSGLPIECGVRTMTIAY